MTMKDLKATIRLREVDREPIVGDICWNFFYGFFQWTKIHVKNGSREGSQEYKRHYMKIYETVSISAKK